MVEQLGSLVSILQVQLDETQRTERGVRGHGNTLLLGIGDQSLLGEVRVVLDLEGGRTDTSVAQQIHQQLSAEVADTNAAGQLLVDQRFHGGPGLLNGGVAELQLVVLGQPPGRVPDGRIDILERNGEVDNEQVEVVKAPVGQLLAADGLDAVTVVEAVPELGHNEELFTLHNSFLNGTGNTLASLDLVAVICDGQDSVALPFRWR